MWEGRRGLETSFIKLSGRSPWASLAGPWRLPVPRQEGQTRLLSWEGRRGGCGLQSRAEGGSHPRLTPELRMQLWGPSIPSPSWRMPPLRARVEENGYRCVLPAPGSWDLLGSAPCPGRRVGGMGRGSSPGRLGTGCGTRATLALLLDKGSSCRAGRSHASSPGAGLWGPSRAVTVARGFSGNVRHYQVSLLGATSRNFPGAPC